PRPGHPSDPHSFPTRRSSDLYSQATARYMGMDNAQCKVIWYAGLLHDYGKIGTREAVLCKPSALTPEEYEHIKEHPRHTYKITLDRKSTRLNSSHSQISYAVF